VKLLRSGIKSETTIKVIKSMKVLNWLVAVVVLGAGSALADSANFATLSLSPGFSAPSGTATGYTGGSFSLSAIKNRDRNNNMCLGFAGDPEVPDYVVVLQKEFPRLRFQVKNKAGDTTLLIQAPDGSVRCGDTTIEALGLSAGTYKVWVGAPTAGVRRDYRLLIRE